MKIVSEGDEKASKESDTPCTPPLDDSFAQTYQTFDDNSMVNDNEESGEERRLEL